jgi:hypothetical protein
MRTSEGPRGDTSPQPRHQPNCNTLNQHTHTHTQLLKDTSFAVARLCFCVCLCVCVSVCEFVVEFQLTHIPHTGITVATYSRWGIKLCVWESAFAVTAKSTLCVCVCVCFAQFLII